MVDKDTFNSITTQVIDTLEGGYYHPLMLQDGRVKDSRYSNSGETMFGIDRRQGGSINTTQAGQQFWNLIDNANAKTNWQWNYKGGNLAPQLKDLASQMIYPEFSRMSDLYLSDKAKPIVQGDSRLLFHFAYATWNGAGWFKKFAKDINDAVADGTTDPDALAQIAINSRTKEGLAKGTAPNSLIAQGGKKIEQLFGSLKSVAAAGIKFAEENPIPTIAISAIAVLVSYFVYNKFKNR